MIILDNLIVGYNGYGVSPTISGHFKKGSMVAVIGPNGIGKSTFLKTLAGLLPPIAGRLDFKSLNQLSVSYLPQRSQLNYFPLTVFDVVSMGCWPKVSLFAKINYHHKIMIGRALKKVDLLNLFHRYIRDLSGGQFQRMLLARILVQQASVILLDEPFQGVDKHICNIMMNAIQQLCKVGCVVIAVSHDRQLISEYFSNILSLTRSCSIWQSEL